MQSFFLKKYFMYQILFSFFIIGVVLVIVLPFSFTKANVVRFFPENCLGGWENPQNAEGLPNVDEEVIFWNKENSAFLDNSNAQIFCGNFSGTVVKDIFPEKFVVKFSWLITDSPILEIEQDILDNEQQIEINDEDTNTEDESENIESGEIDVPEEIVDIPQDIEPGIIENVENTEDALIETPEPVAEDEALSLKKKNSLFFGLIKKVFAQEEPEVIPEVIPEDVNPDITEEEAILVEDLILEESILEEPEEVEIINDPDVSGEIEIDNENIEISPSLNIEEEVLEEKHLDDFLEVSYTTNGSDWTVFGLVNKYNWQNAEFEIPFEDIVTWNNISNLQIRVQNLPSIDSQPVVYLDAMWLEVSYIEIEEERPVVTEIEEEELVIFSPEALHTCSINPFSKVVQRGDTTDFEVNLLPNDKNKPYQIFFGQTPGGVELSIPNIVSTSSLPDDQPVSFLAVAYPDAQLGSFNLILVYTEENKAGDPIPNFCQFNLEVVE